MYCRNCGKQIADGAKFCPYCGTQQTAPVQAQPTQPPRAAQPAPAPQPAPEPQSAPEPQPAPEPAPKPKKKRKRWPIVLVVVLLLAVLAAVGYLVVWPWWRQKSAAAGDESESASAAASESTAEGAAEATPSPTPEPTQDPVAAVADETKANLQKIYSAVAQQNYEEAVSTSETVSAKCLEAYPEAVKFTRDVIESMDLSALHSFTEQNGSLIRDELVPFCAATYCNGALVDIELMSCTGNAGEWKFFNADGSTYPEAPTTFTLDENGSVISCEYGGYTTYSYDENWNLLTEKGYYEDSLSWEKTYSYDSNNNLIDCVEKTYQSDGQLVTSYHTTWSYDADGKLLNELSYSNDDADPYLYYEYSYELDENGKISKRICMNQLTGEKEEAVYDEAGNMVTIDRGTTRKEQTWDAGRLTDVKDYTNYGNYEYKYYYAPRSILSTLNG